MRIAQSEPPMNSSLLSPKMTLLTSFRFGSTDFVKGREDTVKELFLFVCKASNSDILVQCSRRQEVWVLTEVERSDFGRVVSEATCFVLALAVEHINVAVGISWGHLGSIVARLNHIHSMVVLFLNFLYLLELSWVVNMYGSLLVSNPQLVVVQRNPNASGLNWGEGMSLDWSKVSRG